MKGEGPCAIEMPEFVQRSIVKKTSAKDWFIVANPGEILSPGLLFYTERIDENLRRMVELAGGVERLRPHVKTHKCSELIRSQLALGLTKFKCATLAEAEMLARCGAPDVLLAYQPVGPNIKRLVELAQAFPASQLSALVDAREILVQIGRAAQAAHVNLGIFIDLDCGMHRTGIAPGPEAGKLYEKISATPGVTAKGFHAYDGHVHDPDLHTRQTMADAAFAQVSGLRQKLEANGIAVPTVVAGGTPTFPMHAARPRVECSPGTCVLWDFGYGDKFPDLPFSPAAVLLTRVISKPGPDLLCLDLGYKAVASENPPPRVRFLNAPEAEAVLQSEEHLVVRTPRAAAFELGDPLYGIPRHICPTVALHEKAVLIRGGRAVGESRIDARQRSPL